MTVLAPAKYPGSGRLRNPALNLHLDSGFWTNLDPDSDPGLSILKDKIKNNFREKNVL